MKKLIILSNLKNEDASFEDTNLGEKLKEFFDVEVKDLFDKNLSCKDFYLIRNVWGRSGGRDQMLSLYKHFDAEGVRYLNLFNGKGDQNGKKYLVDLYKNGYQVIPTFDSLESLGSEKSEIYLAKPIYGGSSEGILTISKDGLKDVDIKAYVVQPKLDFDFEISFYYIDNQFQYALKTTSSRWELEQYIPADSELKTAQRFADWNPIIGIQRIDFLKMHDGSILLLELEDWCPYLSIFDGVELDSGTFIKNLAKTIGKHMYAETSDGMRKPDRAKAREAGSRAEPAGEDL